MEERLSNEAVYLIRARLWEAATDPWSYRCMVLIFERGKPLSQFLLDLSQDDFNALPGLSASQLIELTHQFLDEVPILPG
jgi:hypothetical protein